ncbi:hypothetical protein OBBRIDRAFT_840191 [Obba rivulosa]|uniref:Uncharacterized protein n=1 Tax=Obba rivulosa TaxID=1052685 RepID=A0A8E2AK62_9APHY|nr:hypothetical protein OBBRIDRAFT_840191 [Obba rivulosa]
MPSLTAVISAIVGGCVLLTLILSQRHSQQRADCYALQLFERNQRRARRVNPIFTSPT